MNNLQLKSGSEGDGQLADTGVHFTWEIQNFCVCKNMKRKLTSRIYHDNWQLLLYTNGENETSKGYLSLYLYNKKKMEIDTTVVISLLNDKSDKLNEKQFDHKFEMEGGWGYASFAKQSFVSDPTNLLLTNGVLKVKCEILEKKIQDTVTIENQEVANESEDETEEEIEEEEKQIEISELTFRLKEFDIYENLFENSNYSDITFVVGGTDIPAHKLILMARSSVFEELFNGSKKEDSKSSIEIDDMTPDAFKELLRFIYAGKVSDIHKYAKPLLIAADKYCVEGLKTKCNEVLSESLNDENALDYLNLADTHKSPNLKSNAIEFVSQHLSTMIKKPEFSMIKNLNSAVIAELFCETGQRMEVLEKQCQ